MESPVPEMQTALLDMADEILGEDTDSSSIDDFDSDDSARDPDFNITKETEQLKCYYETFLSESSEESSPNNPMNTCDENRSPNNNLRNITSSYVSSTSELSPKISRKRQSNKENLKQNVRKKRRQQGLSYISSKGVSTQSKKMKPPCASSCFYLCTTNFSEDIRQEIFNSFWSLNDNEKHAFYAKFVAKKCVKRRRIENSLKKKNTFLYYLEKDNTIHQVCKAFFLSTLSISEKRIYYHFQHLRNEATGIAQSLKTGKHIKRCLPEAAKYRIFDHVKSFPTIDSHYCRASSSRKYLEEGLSLAKMYSLFQEKHPEDSISLSSFSRILNKNFNLGFYKPKKDQCDRCTMFKNKEKEKTLNENDKSLYESHKNQHRLLKLERDRDRNNINPNMLLICFDLQSVFTLPKGFASTFYYKRKLTVFNMTATVCMKTKNKSNITYCAIWSEVHGGRSGNDIASSLIKILERVLCDFQDIEHLVLWSDSCVPQNRSQIMATALLQFMYNYNQIKTVTQKFSEPGHSHIQEVDAAHSAIDKYLKLKEIHSVLDLVRKLKNYKSPKVKLQVIQMVSSDFKMYSKKSHKLYFQLVPFSQIKFIKYVQDDLFKVSYKTSAAEIEYKTTSLMKK